jgi:hypothetical protein
MYNFIILFEVALFVTFYNGKCISIQCEVKEENM